jgi:hypothetical protein
MDLIFEDKKTYCSTWLEKYTLSNAFVYLVAIGIAVVNVIVKGILRCKKLYFIISYIVISTFESAHTKTSELFSRTVKVFVI